MADNSDIQAKVLIREMALDMSGQDKPNVLELYGGEGTLFDLVYDGNIGEHLAFDLKASNRPTWVKGNNMELMPHYINDGWHILDLDAYSNPWALAEKIAKLIEPGEYIMLLTDNSLRGLKSGKAVSKYLFMAACVPDRYRKKYIGTLNRWYDDMIRWSMGRWKQYGAEVLTCKRARSRVSLQCFYYILTFKKS